MAKKYHELVVILEQQWPAGGVQRRRRAVGLNHEVALGLQPVRTQETCNPNAKYAFTNMDNRCESE